MKRIMVLCLAVFWALPVFAGGTSESAPAGETVIRVGSEYNNTEPVGKSPFVNGTCAGYQHVGYERRRI
jgi:hypothetical protein